MAKGWPNCSTTSGYIPGPVSSTLKINLSLELLSIIVNLIYPFSVNLIALERRLMSIYLILRMSENNVILPTLFFI